PPGTSGRVVLASAERPAHALGPPHGALGASGRRMGTPKLLDPPPGAARRARRPPRSRDTGGLRELVPGRGPHGRGAVVRSRLVAPLVQAPRPLVVLVAPAGWGKSTVLAQWRRVEPRPLRAVSLSRSHDDAAALEASVAAALADLGAAVPE